MIYHFTIEVSYRKGEGPQWDNQTFEVALDDIPEELSEEELQQWAKIEVIAQLENDPSNIYGDHWVIEKVINMGQK